MKGGWSEIRFASQARAAERIRLILSGLARQGWMENESRKEVRFTLWVPERQAQAAAKAIKQFKVRDFSRRRVKPERWEESWKRFFKPKRIGEKLYVVPSWHSSGSPRGLLAVRIKPGMAFGAGDHPTTEMCLSALEKLVREGEWWLDFGTGSGILAIAAARLGASRVVAADEDPLALESARDNIRRNRLTGKIRLVQSDSPEGLGKFDGIVSNLVTESLALFAPFFLGILKPGGKIILSGVPRKKASWLILAYRESGARVSRLGAQGGWTSILVRPWENS